MAGILNHFKEVLQHEETSMRVLCDSAARRILC